MSSGGSSIRSDRWIAEAKAGSTDALDRLIELLSEQLWDEMGARRRDARLGPSQGLSDLIQDTLLRVRLRFARFERGTFADLRQWTRAILYRRWQELSRNHRARTKDEQKQRIWMAVVAPRAGRRCERLEQVELEEEQQKAFRHFETLQSNDQHLIRARLFHGLTFQQIAETTGWSGDAARMGYKRALNRLREKFESNDSSQ